jgi:hypothetical protein
MDLNDVLNDTADQERGTWHDLLDPVKGEPTGMRFRVAGPDSTTQRKAELKLADDLAEIADQDGRVTSEQREKARIAALAACVLDFEIVQDGEPLPFNTANCIRVLRAAKWIEAQVDGMASTRNPLA